MDYQPPTPILPADFHLFYASLTPDEKKLHELAKEMLGSSYFVQWTHLYQSWKKSITNDSPLHSSQRSSFS